MTTAKFKKFLSFGVAGIVLLSVLSLLFWTSITKAAQTVDPLVYLPILLKQQPTCFAPTISPSDLANEASVVSGLNSQRVLNLLPPLVETPELVQAARRHSLDMAINGFTGHTGSDDSLPSDRVTQACYDWVATSEIIGWGFGGNPESMIDWWMNSPVHRGTILSDRYMDFGAGYIYKADSEWQHYWTVNFGKRVTESGFSAEEQYVCEYRTEGEFGGVALIFLSSEPCTN